MATLADAFLADLEDLSDASEAEEEPRQEGADEQARPSMCLVEPVLSFKPFCSGAVERRSLPLQAAAQPAFFCENSLGTVKLAELQPFKVHACLVAALSTQAVLSSQRDWLAVCWQCRWRKMKMGCPASTTWMRWRTCGRATGIILSCWCVFARSTGHALHTPDKARPEQAPHCVEVRVPRELRSRQGAQVCARHKCRAGKEVCCCERRGCTRRWRRVRRQTAWARPGRGRARRSPPTACSSTATSSRRVSLPLLACDGYAVCVAQLFGLDTLTPHHCTAQPTRPVLHYSAGVRPRFCAAGGFRED